MSISSQERPVCTSNWWAVARREDRPDPYILLLRGYHKYKNTARFSTSEWITVGRIKEPQQRQGLWRVQAFGSFLRWLDSTWSLAGGAWTLTHCLITKFFNCLIINLSLLLNSMFTWSFLQTDCCNCNTLNLRFLWRWSNISRINTGREKPLFLYFFPVSPVEFWGLRFEIGYGCYRLNL